MAPTHFRSRGRVDEARLGPRRDVVYGPADRDPTPEEIVRHAQSVVNQTKETGPTMHYKNGRKAKNGDKIVLFPSYGPPAVGVLYDAQAGNDHCNGRIATIAPSDPCPNLKECLHLDDVLNALPADQTQVPDASANAAG